MPDYVFQNMNIECCFRLFIACACGGIIGMERTKRNKGAGIRTHIIVALGAALFVIISKYGFNDIVYLNGVQVDVSRVASNVVTGVSFLGAGIIFMRGDMVQGLTTAAGIWVTAAIGVAIGAGMYVTGLCGAVLILFIQEIFHCRSIFRIDNMTTGRIVVCIEDSPSAYQDFQTQMRKRNIQVVGNHIKRHKDHTLTYTLDIRIPRSMQMEDILDLINECKDVKSIGM